MYIIGIDIAKKPHEVCFMNRDGDVLDGNSFNIPNTLSGLEKLQKMLTKYGLNSDNSIVGMEATGHYWLVLYSWLTEEGFDVKSLILLSRMHTRCTSQDERPNRCEMVARVILLGEYQETPVSEETTLSLELCRFRLSQVQTCGDLKRRCIAILDQVFPEYSQLFTNTFGISSKVLLKEYSTPEELASIHTIKLTNLLKKASKGHFGKEKALEVKAVAKKSIGISFATDAFAFR